jgi:membrane-associated protease RseP (regulator of RpoE activity)
VRLPRIDDADLNLFQFDYDLTFMVFFLNADERIYGRFGGRDAKTSEGRMSLAGLRYAMEATLRMHAIAAKAAETAPSKREPPKYIRDLAAGRRIGRCVHCHQVNEMLNANLKRDGQWSRESVWRYPLPENLGVVLEVDRGNVVDRIVPDSLAARAGLRSQDTIEQLNGLPVHSFGDAQYALERAPRSGAITISWQRGEQTFSSELHLPDGWRKTDVSWRPSLRKLVPSLYLSGDELSANEKGALGLDPKQMAFRQEAGVPARARDAGLRGGDIIIGVDDKKLEMTVTDFYWYVRRNYLVGDVITINVLRIRDRVNVPITLR